MVASDTWIVDHQLAIDLFGTEILRCQSARTDPTPAAAAGSCVSRPGADPFQGSIRFSW